MKQVAPSSGDIDNTGVSKLKNFIDNFSSHPCTVCELSFDTKDELNSHLIDKHGYCRTYLCPICKKKFATKDAIKKHMMENHRKSDSNKSVEVNKKRHQCMICDNSYDERQHLTKHISDVHDSYYKNAFLKKSQSKIPMNSKLRIPFLPEKAKTAQNDGNKKRPYPCSFCDAGYNFKQNLITHMADVHNVHKISNEEASSSLPSKENKPRAEKTLEEIMFGDDF